jgi:hypothetical protein
VRRLVGDGFRGRGGHDRVVTGDGDQVAPGQRGRFVDTIQLRNSGGKGRGLPMPRSMRRYPSTLRGARVAGDALFHRPASRDVPDPGGWLLLTADAWGVSLHEPGATGCCGGHGGRDITSELFALCDNEFDIATEFWCGTGLLVEHHAEVGDRCGAGAYSAAAVTIRCTRSVVPERPVREAGRSGPGRRGVDSER